MKWCISDVKMKGDRSLLLSGKIFFVDSYITALCPFSKCCFAWLADLPFNTSKHLCIAHYLPEVNVEHVPTFFQHDIVIVAVADAQDEGSNAPPGTRVQEVHHSLHINRKCYARERWSSDSASLRKGFSDGLNLLVVFLSSVKHVKPFLQSVLSEASTQTPLFMNLCQGHCLWYHFHQTWQA